VKSKRLSRLAELGCILCWHLGFRDTPAQIHHLREGMGMGQRNSDDRAIPLCYEHHQGDSGYHGLGKRAFEERYKLTELDLLELTEKRWYGR